MVVLTGTVTAYDSGEWITRGSVSSPRLANPRRGELLDILERPDADRAALIGRLHVRDDAAWLAELLIDLEDDVGEVARLRLTYSLRAILRASKLDDRRPPPRPPQHQRALDVRP